MRINDEEVERNASAKRKVNENLFEEYPSGQPVMEVKNLRKVFRGLTGNLSIMLQINIDFLGFFYYWFIVFVDQSKT